MSDAPEVHLQHLIDPETCIRCNTCEETCPVKAITHDARNYVVDPETCNGCKACIAPCPTGAIDNWRTALKAHAFSTAEQFAWDALPSQQALGVVAGSEVESRSAPAAPPVATPSANGHATSRPPWSAAQPSVNLYTHHTSAWATVVGNYRVTDPTSESDTHHIVLDFGTTACPVLEGQSIGVLPPGTDHEGRPHHARQYSIASPRDGERAGYNNVSLTVKRVTRDHAGDAVRGVCSNYLCDLERGDKVRVIGPFGTTFLMPNHTPSHLIMICTGTGAAPMRAMTERRRRLPGNNGRLLLFFGARTQGELPYFGPLMNLSKGFIDVNLAFSRTPGQPKRYVQDVMRERGESIAELLRDDAYIYVCGLRGMETGVMDAFSDIAKTHGLAWEPLLARLRAEGRLHLETY